MSTSDPISADSQERLQRLGRLTLKELREILRDRRTIITLVLMPLLMYPLLAIVFEQFFMSQSGTIKIPRYVLGFENEEDGAYLATLLREGGLELIDIGKAHTVDGQGPGAKPVFEIGHHTELARCLNEFEINVGLKLLSEFPQDFSRGLDGGRDLAVDVELLYREDSVKSREAAGTIEQHLRTASEKLLERRLKKLHVLQRSVPISVARRSIDEPVEARAEIADSIYSVVPFILILMTVTGAVYPAIDLTAGERERGTLEILVAAPIPRMGVLLAKYVAVLTVALLTAIANLLTMTVTISLSPFAESLFGSGGLSFGVVAAILGLLLLFAAFFSAVLLAITSSARSFKEAQAYLIPLMLAALAPGVLSLMPGLPLSGALLVTPLANIVLLGRDLLKLKATAGSALVVVGSTLIYAGAAIALAARIFGAETVLYSSQSGWSDLFRRPRQRQSAPSLTAALCCVAGIFLLFWLYFALLSSFGGLGAGIQLAAGIGVTLFGFGILPAVACWMRHVSIPQLFPPPSRALFAFGGALLAGLSLWTIDHETIVALKQWQGIELNPQIVRKLQASFEELRSLSLPYLLLSLAIVPAVFEEAFFRGYLFAALGTTRSPRFTIIVTAVAFGVFHWMAPNPLAAERVVSSTLTGLVLGWIRWRTGSVWPGMLLHLCHNGLLVSLMYFEPQLSARGIGVTETSHLPMAWLAAGVLVTASGLLMIAAFAKSSPHRSA